MSNAVGHAEAAVAGAAGQAVTKLREGFGAAVTSIANATAASAAATQHALTYGIGELPSSSATHLCSQLLHVTNAA